LIKGKKILITGGSSGLGKSLALKLASNKNDIFCIGRTIVRGKNIISVNCNFENLRDIDKKLQSLNIKKLDYVFLNAGILGNLKKINKIKSNEIFQILKINVLANKQILDFFIKKKIKVKLIIGISSGAALAPKLGWYLYCCSKSAFKFLLESYAVEDKHRKYLNISPGLIKTKMQKKICNIDENKIPSVKKFKILNRNNKVPSPDEVAENLISQVMKLEKLQSGSYIDIRKK
tara:strand:- start:2198 stop:2896 length:699 start_codon:yes stop_codon:yes gene_type:complete